MGLSYSRGKEQEYFDQCEKTLTHVDRSLVCLASSIDSIHTTANLLQITLEDLVSNNHEMERKQESLNLTKRLLRSVENSLYFQKISILQGISEFIKLMKEKPENKIVMTKYMKTLDNLEIDKYITSFEQNQNNQACEQESAVSNVEIDSSVDLDMSKYELKQRIKQLEKDNANNEKLRSDYDELSAELVKAKEEIESRDAKINGLELDKKRLKNELEILQHRIETIPVQLYCQRSGDLMNHIEQELLRDLKENVGLHKKELDVTKCETSSDIRPNIPLLILCISTSRLGTDAANAIQRIPQNGNTALLIFHHKDEHALPSQTSDRVLTGPDFKALRGIYDLAYLSDKGIYFCDMNTNGISSLMDFICRVTIENVSAEITLPIDESSVMSR